MSKKKVKIFDELMGGLQEAIQFRAGAKNDLRVTQVVAPPAYKPVEIKQIRQSLNASQPLFASFLGTSVGAIRSWEQGSRKPQQTAMRLLSMVKKYPDILLSVFGLTGGQDARPRSSKPSSDGYVVATHRSQIFTKKHGKTTRHAAAIEENAKSRRKNKSVRAKSLYRSQRSV